MIKYGEPVSNKPMVLSGIAQGTFLGPLLFIFYINDCIKVLSKVKVSLFADDCILYYTGNNWENVYSVLQNELTKFVNWTAKNMLKLNEKNKQAMIVCMRNRLL